MMSSFDLKNSLLTKLRGYDIPTRRNYLNASLNGFGHHHHHHRHHKHKKDNPENRYNKVLAQLLDDEDSPLAKYLQYFANPGKCKEFFGSEEKDIRNKLANFTRFYIISRSLSSSEFVSGVEGFLSDLVSNPRYIKLLETMEELADSYKEKYNTATGEEEVEIPEEFETIKENSFNNFVKAAEKCFNTDIIRLDYDTVLNMILDGIVVMTENPADFELNFDKYKNAVITANDNDVFNIFSEDLQDTAAKDDDDLEEDDDYYDDDGFVVSDSEDPYEPVNKKQKTGGEMINWEELRKYDRPGGEMIFRPWEKHLKNMTLEKLRRRSQQRDQGGEMINRPWEIPLNNMTWEKLHRFNERRGSSAAID